MSDEGGSNGNGQGARPPRIHVLEVIGNVIVGGVESHVGNLIRHLPADQFRVTCLCPYESAYTVALRQAGFEVFFTPMRDDPPWASVVTAVELIRQRRVDLLHAHIQNAHTLAGIVGRLTGRPVLATVHSMNLPAQELSISRLTGTHLLVVCQAAYFQALALGVPAERVTLIPNGVDLDAFRPGRRGPEFRRTIGVPEDATLVGFVGRIAWEKGPDKFVRVAERVHQTWPDVHFALVGEGPMEHEVAGLIERMGAGGYVHLAGLRQNSQEVYPALDLFVQTSRSEGMPLSILEAMACGLPVVAIAAGGVAELVEEGTSGIQLSPGDWPGVACPYPGDWEGVASAIVDLLARPARLKEMGAAGRRRAEELFDLRAGVRRTGQLFRRLAQEGAVAAGVWRETWADATSVTTNSTARP